MRNLLLTCLCLLSLSACGPTVSSFYRPIPGVTPEKVLKVANTCLEPELFSIQIKKDYDIEMYKQGYGIIGTMDFNGPAGQEGAIMRFAKKIGACAVIINTNYSGTMTATMAIPQYNPGTTVQYNSTGTLNSPRGTTTYNATTTGQTPGTWSNAYVPYSVQRFQYACGFFVKFKEPAVLGMCFNTIPDNIKKSLNIEHGLMVKAVRNNTPADAAGFMADDIITNVNNEVVLTQDAFSQFLQTNQGSEVNFTIIRDGKELEKKVILGKNT
jgi:hypothetical protein